MSNEKFTDDHEWLRQDDDGTLFVGITEYAQDQLGDIVYVELPEAGANFIANTDMAVVESVKAAGEVKIPVSGEVVEVNSRLVDEPELVNTDPMGEGWFIRMTADNIDDLNELMNESEYNEYIETL
ncbi:MAG: glycine cleavage system protein GcvH [Gammaproteobacteria bacterium]|jgi:glycine cleavage system H protein